MCVCVWVLLLLLLKTFNGSNLSVVIWIWRQIQYTNSNIYSVVILPPCSHTARCWVLMRLAFSLDHGARGMPKVSPTVCNCINIAASSLHIYRSKATPNGGNARAGEFAYSSRWHLLMCIQCPS